MVEELPIKGIDHIEFYVGDARKAAAYFCNLFGFREVAYAGPITGVKDRSSYLLEQNDIRLLVTGSLEPGSSGFERGSYIADHVSVHGDGVKNIALLVDDAKKVHEDALKRGAIDYRTLYEIKYKKSRERLDIPGICLYGDVVHTFVDKNSYDGIFLPGYERRTAHDNVGGVGLKRIDHIVANVNVGEMEVWDKFYENIFGFEKIFEVDENDISTEYSGLKSVVRANEALTVRFPINEPVNKKEKSQIQYNIDNYGGPHVQHIALETDDIIHTMTELRKKCVKFLDAPSDYYQKLLRRFSNVDTELENMGLDFEALKQRKLLVDKDADGILVQIFTDYVQDRDTSFFEVLQRFGATTFGHGNFQTLYVSIEEDQRKKS